MSTEAQRPATMAIATSDGHAVSERHETAAAALAARARADIEARTIVALNRPRVIHAFRQKLLEACDRSGFAAVARYSKPLGGKKFAEGFTIRFAEECVRNYANLDISTMVVSEDDERRVIRCAVTDLEINVPWATEVVIPKTVERRSVKDGDEVIRKRINSEGEGVYIRRATEDEIAISQNRLCAKAIRNLVLNHIPSDILEEADEHILATMQTKDDKDPQGSRKLVVDLFYKRGVSVTQLIEFLGHSIEEMNNAELHVLRNIHAAMKEDESIRWADVMESKGGDKKGEVQPDSAKGANATLASKLAGKKPPAVGTAEIIVPPHIAKILGKGDRATDDEKEELRQFAIDHPEVM